jgi:hypothetical protein
MRMLIISLVFLRLSLPALAQDNKKKYIYNNSTYPALFEPKLSGEIYYPKLILGKEYFNETYWDGDIEFYDGQIATDKRLRYNGRIDGLLFLPPNSGREILLDRYFIQGFRLKIEAENTLVYFRKINVKKEFSTDTTDVFAQLLYRNKLSLYAFRRFVHTGDVIVPVENSQISKEFYEASTIYYFQLPNGKTIGFKKFRKRDLYKLFPGNKEIMKKLFREKHQRRFRKEDDLIKITEILTAII